LLSFHPAAVAVLCSRCEARTARQSARYAGRYGWFLLILGVRMFFSSLLAGRRRARQVYWPQVFWRRGTMPNIAGLLLRRFLARHWKSQQGVAHPILGG